MSKSKHSLQFADTKKGRDRRAQRRAVIGTKHHFVDVYSVA